MDNPNSAAHVPIRSNRGCWTCRLRKKKCDEVFPGCLRCASVNVECHYGPKPKWIDSALLGKQELERIKRIVGASASRKRAAFRAKSQIPPKSPSAENVESSPQGQFLAGGCDEKLQLESESTNCGSSLSISGLSRLPDQPKWIEDHEASLMMHYLDHVFFIQFRFYTPPVSTGGRGWLLSLLAQTKPLYHAALSLSACLAQEGGETQTDYLQELERHHNLTLKELQVFIQAQSEHASTAVRGNVQILACMVLLISFELFHGGVNTWQVHLRAASQLVLLLHGLIQHGDSNRSATIVRSQSSPELLSPHRTSNVHNSPHSAALDFFTGAIIWFDALACISTASRPYLFDHYHSLLRSPELASASTKGQNMAIELHGLMGCQNWAMITIGEIAELKSWKDKESQLGSLDIHQVAEAANNIQSELQIRDAQICNEIDSIRERYSGPPPHHRTVLYQKYTTLVITRMFVCAALVYLQTVVSSDLSILNISAALSNFMAIMSHVPDPRMFRGLVWPLCVMGCMASSQPHQETFRNTITDAMSDPPKYGNSGQALQILEKSWEMQRERGRLIDCATAIQELGTCVLLV